MTLYRITKDRPYGAELNKGDTVVKVKKLRSGNFEVNTVTTSHPRGRRDGWIVRPQDIVVAQQKDPEDHKKALKEKYGIG